MQRRTRVVEGTLRGVPLSVLLQHDGYLAVQWAEKTGYLLALRGFRYGNIGVAWWVFCESRNKPYACITPRATYSALWIDLYSASFDLPEEAQDAIRELFSDARVKGRCSDVTVYAERVPKSAAVPLMESLLELVEHARKRWKETVVKAGNLSISGANRLGVRRAAKCAAQSASSRENESPVHDASDETAQ